MLSFGFFQIPKRSFLGIVIILLSLLAVFYFFTVKKEGGIEQTIDQYIKSYVKNNQFSGSVLITRNGEIIFDKAYGQASYTFDVENTTRTKFNIGSITKQFTAMAIMIAQEKGLLNINDPITKYLPENYPRENCQKNGVPITIFNLLTHTSGIYNYVKNIEWILKNGLDYTPIEEIISSFKYKELEFIPGEKFAYCNSGYVLLAYILQIVSGKKYKSFLEENIFNPLGMLDTNIFEDEKIIKNMASNYTLKNGQLINAKLMDSSMVIGTGDLYSTTHDLELWDKALYSNKLVSTETMKKILTPFKENYAFGWKIEYIFNHKRYRHDGTIDDIYHSSIARFTDDKVCIIVLSNFGQTPMEKIRDGLATIIFESNINY